WYPAQDVARLAFENLADRIQGGEAHGFGPAVLQHRDVRGSDVDGSGEVCDRHLLLRELDIEVDDDGHQTPSARSCSSWDALCNSPRSTTTSRAKPDPRMTPRMQSMLAGDEMPTAVRVMNDARISSVAAMTRARMPSTHLNASRLKMLDPRTRESSRQTQTRESCTQRRKRTETTMPGTLR